MFSAIVANRAALPVGKKGYRKQTVGIFLIGPDGVQDDFPTPVHVLRGPEEKDYSPGQYTIHPSSFTAERDEFGGSHLAALRLVLVPTVSKALKTA